MMQILFRKAEIEYVIGRLADELNKVYTDDDYVVIGILYGSFIFLADLVRELKTHPIVDFIGVRSYVGMTSKSEVELYKDVSYDINNKNVLVIEDIVDTGITIKFLKKYFLDKGAKTVRICSLLNKYEGRLTHANIDFVGINISNKFVVGYGLDYNGKYRSLPNIYILDDPAKR